MVKLKEELGWLVGDLFALLCMIVLVPLIPLFALFDDLRYEEEKEKEEWRSIP